MKTKFKYGFKKYQYAVMAAVIVLSLAVIVLNVFRLVKYGYDPDKLLGQITSFIISVLIIVLISSILISSYYEVTEKSFVLRWGILKNEIPVKDITKIVHNLTKDKIAVYYGAEDNFMVVSAAKIPVLDIVDALRSKNKKILYQSLSDEPVEPAE